MKFKVCSIMICDIIVSEQQAAHGGIKLREVIADTESIILQKVEKFEAKVIKQLKTGLIILFHSPTTALMCAMEMQRKSRDHNKTLSEEERVFLKTTVDTGEVTLLHDDIQGDVIGRSEYLQEVCEPGEVLFSVSTYLAMWRSKVPSSRVSENRLSELPYPMEVYRVDDDELESVRIVDRSLSYFGLLTFDGKSRERTVFDAPHHLRVTAGVIDVWIGILLLVVTSVLFQFGYLKARLTSVYRIEAEDFNISPHNIEGASGGQGLKVNDRTQLTLPLKVPKDRYRVVLAYALPDVSWKETKALVNVAEIPIPVRRSFKDQTDLYAEAIGEAVSISAGDSIQLKVKADSTPIIIDYIELIPEQNESVIPKGLERYYRFKELYKLIGYDDKRPLRFFLLIPLFVLGSIFVSLTLLSTTLGGACMGLKVVKHRTQEPIGIWSATLRTLSWIGIPLWGWTSIGRERQWSDLISSSQVVIQRAPKGEVQR